MIVTNLRSIPTKFAIMLAESCDLYIPKEKENGNEEEWHELRDKLTNFQKMALSANFDDCLIAYFNFKLNKKQKDILQVIHKSTKQWLVGHVAEVMLENLERASRTNLKDKKEIAQLFIDNFINEGEEKNDPEKTKSLLVRFANLPKDAEI